MQPDDNTSGLPLIQGLEEVNSKVRLVKFAWTHLSTWQETGAECALTTRQIAIARGLLIEAIEEWAFAIGNLLRIVRAEGDREELQQNLERSLRRASVYLSGMSALDPDTRLVIRFGE
ncbi:MAG TPA: hypothetical protein VGN52_25630 [Burkholderiales bacterium]|jgi:hypothetical protein